MIWQEPGISKRELDRVSKKIKAETKAMAKAKPGSKKHEVLLKQMSDRLIAAGIMTKSGKLSKKYCE